jgi:hypothetical protein
VVKVYPTLAPSGATGAGVYYTLGLGVVLGNQAIDCTGAGFAFHGVSALFNVQSQFSGMTILRSTFAYPTFQSTATGTILQCRGYDSGCELVAGGSITITSLQHYNVRNASVGSGGAVTTQCGLYVAELTSGGTNWGVYTAGATKSYFGGSVGVGVTPTARLHLPASTAAANTASLKIDPGTLATAAVSGNVESDGTHLYWTDSGGTRKQLDNA